MPNVQPTTLADAKHHWATYARHVISDAVRASFRQDKPHWGQMDGYHYRANASWKLWFYSQRGCVFACTDSPTEVDAY